MKIEPNKDPLVKAQLVALEKAHNESNDYFVRAALGSSMEAVAHGYTLQSEIDLWGVQTFNPETPYSHIIRRHYMAKLLRRISEEAWVTHQNKGV